MKMLAPIGDIATPFDSTSMKDFMGQFKNTRSSNIQNDVNFYNYHMHKKKSIDKIMELIQCISHIDIIQNNQFLDVVPQNSTCLRCPMSQLGLGWIWLGGCN